MKINNMKCNVDINYANRDDDWGHFISTECIEAQNITITNYNLHNYNACNYNVHDYTAHNYNVQNSDVRNIGFISTCLPIFTTICIVGSIVINTTTRLFC